jgi:hypothetical protein
MLVPGPLHRTRVRGSRKLYSSPLTSGTLYISPRGFYQVSHLIQLERHSLLILGHRPYLAIHLFECSDVVPHALVPRFCRRQSCNMQLSQPRQADWAGRTRFLHFRNIRSTSASLQRNKSRNLKKEISYCVKRLLHDRDDDQPKRICKANPYPKRP